MEQEIPKVRVMVGLNYKNGLGQIIPLNAGVDMGDSGRINCPLYLFDERFKFSYSNPKTGRTVYREQ